MWLGSDIYGVCTGIVNFKFKDFDAAVEDLSACVKLDTTNKSAYTYLVSIKHIYLADSGGT